MKISDGYWLDRTGFDVKYATQIYDIETDGSSVTIRAVCEWIHGRGQTLGGPMLTVRLTSALEDSIKVSIEHFSGVKQT